MPSASAEYARAAGIGAVAGLRSMIPAAVSTAVLAREPRRLSHSMLQRLASPKVAATLTAFAVGELVADKLPRTPPRIRTPSLLGRTASGALTAALLSASHRRSARRGALVGAAAAIAASYLGFAARATVARRLRAPDLAVALGEDVLAIGAAVALACA